MLKRALHLRREEEGGSAPSPRILHCLLQKTRSVDNEPRELRGSEERKEETKEERRQGSRRQVNYKPPFLFEDYISVHRPALIGWPKHFKGISSVG